MFATRSLVSLGCRLRSLSAEADDPFLMHAPRTLPTVIALVVLMSSSALAATPEEVQRAATEARRVAAAGRLNVLKADDTQLETAVATLDKGIVVQNSTAAAARQALKVAETGVGAAEVRLATTQKQMTSLRTEVTTAAVRAYVHPGGGGLLSLVRAQSLGEASRRQSLLAHVVQSDSSILERLRGVRQDQESEQANVRRARDLAAQRRREADERLTGLRRVRSDQARVKSALDARIRGVLAEVDSLSREEARLTALIRSRTQPVPGSGARVSGAGFSMPSSGTITSRFGPRWGRLHAGLDIASAFGTPIKAAKAGRVILAGSNGGYGNSVIIDHGGGFTTLYAHMSRLRVRDGAVVKGGQQIGDMGSSGASTGNHVHFEIRVGGTAQNPQRYL